MPDHVFVVGPDDFNRRRLARIEEREGLIYRELLSFEEVAGVTEFSFTRLLDRSERTLRESEGDPDAIIGLWDFPSTTLVPALCERLDLPGVPLEAVLRCEHKYWSRLLQRDAAPEHVPPFEALDPFDDGALEGLELDPPFWIKPIKAHSSHLGYRIDDLSDLREVLPRIRRLIPKLGDPFNEALDLIDLPDRVEGIGGRHCIVEGIIGGEQCTLEGHVSEGNVEIYGVVDSVRYPGVSSFLRYQYPSRLPPQITARMADITSEVMQRIGYDHGLFNIEFFYDEDADHVWILEINPRPSQSHADVFEKVDGISHQWLLLQFALGRDPDWEEGQGEFTSAAKFFFRHFEDVRVDSVPSEETIERLERDIPGCEIHVQAQQGRKLSEQPYQDSYSYEVARVYLGGDDTEHLLEKYRAVTDALEFEFQPIEEA